MKKSFQIAHTELNILFYSPIAWLLLILFIIQGGFAFADLLAGKEASQQLGALTTSLTQDIFGGKDGFFTVMQQYLYLYVPLLTMGLLSREIGSGSIKLLQSSPVTTAQIMMGKYLAMLGYNLLLVGILAAFVGVGAFSIKHLDYGFVCSALFGIYLLLAAYSAIGLFLSSLTGYQVVAAISTLAVLGALSYIGDVGNGIEIVRDITYWFAMDRHTSYALRGLLSSKDISYFLLIIVLFLTLTTMKLNSGRIARSPAANAVRHIVLVSVIVAIGYGTSLPQLSGYWDVTRFQTQSYTSQSLAIVNQVQGPVTLTTYANVLGGYSNIGAPKFRNLERTNLEHMERYLPQMKMEYVAYYDTASTIRLDPNVPVADQALRKAFTWGYDPASLWSPDSLRKQINLVPEQGMLVRMLTVNGQSTPLRMFYDMVAYPQEAEVIAALKRILDKPLRVGMLNRNDERSAYGDGDKDYESFTTLRTSRLSWINQGVELITLGADSSLLHVDSLDLLIIADPYRPYTTQQLHRIHTYIKNGGNLLLAGEPGKQALLNPLSAAFGVRFEDGMLLQESKELETNLIQARFTDYGKETGFGKLTDTIITMLGATSLSYRDTAGFHVTSVLETDERYVWKKFGDFNLKTERITFQPTVDHKMAVAVAVAATRQIGGREQRIFVCGDADVMSKAELGRFNVRNGNGALTTRLLRWYSYGQYPPDTERPKPIDDRLLVSKSQVSAIRISTIFILPALLAGLGAFVLIRRKRK